MDLSGEDDDLPAAPDGALSREKGSFFVEDSTLELDQCYIGVLCMSMIWI